MPDYVAGGGIKNTEEEIRNATVWLRQKTIAELASEYNEATTSVGPANELNNFLTAEFCALIFDNSNLTAAKAASIMDNSNLTAAKAASIMDNSNLTAAKAASICDSANITSAKIKAILDTGSLTVADKIAALLDGDSLTADDAATHVNSGTYTDDLMASAFDSSYLAAAKAASIMDNSNLTAAKAASIIDNANLTDEKAYNILSNMSSASKRAEILNEIIKMKTPTLSGSWETEPSDLGNIVDGDSATSTTQGSVYAGVGEGKNGDINIDLGRKYPVDAIYAKWSGSQEGSGDCWYSCHNYLQKSVDGSTYNNLIDALSQDGSVSVAADVRYLRIRTSASACSASGCWRRTKITVYLIKFTT